IDEKGVEKGFNKLAPENFLDLWYLSNLIEAKDRITARTVRNIFIEREGKKEKSKKKALALCIEVEKVELEENKLRVKGKIVEAPEEVQKGSYHTIEISFGNKVLIEKKAWKKEQIEKIEKLTKRTKKTFSLKDFFLHLGKDDGLAVYGLEEVKNFALIGAVKTLFVPLEKIDKKIEGIMEEVEKRGGEIEFVSEKEELGKKFCSEYGIGAILRFRIS
ncbi:MAG: hypothetical protein QW412_01840, partial [Candidatus Aenigmatarchaeota archaeon]